MDEVVSSSTPMVSDARPAAWEDVSPAWMRAHSHLRPLNSILSLPADEFRCCGFCDGGRAIRVRSRLRFGASLWVDGGVVHYCYGCGRYGLSPDDRAAALVEHPAAATAPVTAVDARLWSSAPTLLNIEPTTRCNFNCWYCVGRHMKQVDIRVEDFAKVLDNCPTLRTVALVGEGEPLMHAGFFEMVRMCKERGIRVVIVSNGSAFTASVVQKLCENEVAYVAVSIDSADPATFATSRIGGDLNKIWAGVARLRRYRDEHGYRYPKIALKGTLFAHTRDELPRIVAEAKRHGVEIFESFQPLNPKTTYVRIYPPEHLHELAVVDEVAAAIRRDGERALRELRSAWSFAEEEGIAVPRNGRPNGLRRHCDEEWVYSLLSGDVTPCCQIKTPMDPDWNIVNHSLEAILADHHYQNVRFNLWNGLFPQYCRGCWKTR